MLHKYFNDSQKSRHTFIIKEIKNLDSKEVNVEISISAKQVRKSLIRTPSKDFKITVQYIV